MDSGFFNILKPSGPTSSDIVVKLKKLLNEKKIGHLGTLDPLAAGVLPVAVGKATRLFDYLTYKKKKYRAIFTFGIATDTADAEGKITGVGALPSENDVINVLDNFRGNITQYPPKYSAVKINGRKAYELSRQGIEFQLQSREITVYSLEFIGSKDSSFTFDIECSGGTYIRSLCTDIAASLGTVAYMSMLIRLKSGCFDISDSVTLEELEDNGKEHFFLPMEYALKDFKKIELNSGLFKDISNGVSVDIDMKDEKDVLVYCRQEFFGIGNIADKKLKLKTYLR